MVPSPLLKSLPLRGGGGGSGTGSQKGKPEGEGRRSTDRREHGEGGTEGSGV